MDSGYYNAGVIGAAIRAGAYFSVTARLGPAVKAAIAAIPGEAWTAIKYPRAVWDDQLGRWASDAEIADAQYTAFTSKKGQAITARLVVRRVRGLSPQAAAGQHELFPLWRYHPVFTDSPFTLVQADEQHRDHAIVEQALADLTSGPLAHMPSGSFTANAAWLALAGIAHNLMRAAGCLASPRHAKARGATIRADLVSVAARLARRGRGHLTLHLPPGWHREHEWMSLFDAACGPPRARAA
jgi:Transposase DDE domain group 1